MRILSHPARLAFAALILFATAGVASAHHGWAWTSEDEWFELSGTLTEIYIGQPHATLAIDAEGTLWMVDLAPLSGTLASGFDEDAASVGENVTVIGHRAEDPDWPAMKAVRVIVPSGTYDVYPAFAAEYDAAA